MKRIILGSLALLLPMLARADLHPSTGVRLGSTLQSGATFYVSSATVVSFNASTATITNLVGTTTNDNAAVGNYGQYISSSILSGAENTPPGTATYFDVASIPLTAGDWDVSAIIAWTGGTTVQRVTGGVGTATGNNAAGLSFGNTWVQGLGPTAASDVNFAVPAVRQSLSGSATIYLKGYAEYTVGTPKAYGRISARRVR